MFPCALARLNFAGHSPLLAGDPLPDAGAEDAEGAPPVDDAELLEPEGCW